MSNKYLITWFKNSWWVLFLFVFSLISLLAETNIGKWKMVDLEVYYQTAQHMIAGEDIYNIAVDAEGDGHYVFKYSPVAAMLYIPLAIIPFWVTKLIYWISLTLFVGIALQIVYRLIESESLASTRRNVIFFALLTILIHIDTELSLGQVNLLLLMIYVLAIYAFKKNKNILLGFLVAGSLFIKPFGLIFLPYLFLKRRYLSLLYCCGFVFVLFLLPAIYYPTIESFLGLYQSWFNELFIELGNKQDLMASANHTIFSVLARHTPLQFIMGNEVWQKIYQVIILILIGVLFITYERKHQSIVAEMSVLVILIPLLAFTSKNAFLFAMPLAMYLISQFKNQTLFVKILIIGGCAFIGGNLYEVYGAKISQLLTDVSIYSIGSACLLAAAFLSKKPDHQPPERDSIAL